MALSDVEKFLRGLGLGKYVSAFTEAEIDVSDAAHLTEADLKELGLPLGPRRRFQAAVEQLASARPVPGTANMSSDRPTPGDAERRQLTVLFCDLVGSTELSRRLDPEDLRDVMRRYQDAVAGAMSRYGGHLAKFLGDGVLAYFGWPQAYEDQAERAVRAALDAIAAVAELTVSAGSESLQARAGIATGQVVVGDLVGATGRDAEAVTGETPNLAARLQAAAEPGAVIIGESTRRLVGRAFETEALDDLMLKGFADPVPAWRVTGARGAESRFAAARSSDLTEFVGREHELGLLHDRWHTAKDGEGQIVLLTGEPGIGKSRLVQALQEQIADEPHIQLFYQCSSYHANSALYPIARRLEYAARLKRGDSDDIRLDKLEGLLVRGGERDNTLLALFADLLSIPSEHRYGPMDLAPQQRKERLLSILVEELCGLAARAPVLAVVEDAHWIDPTTLELIQLAVPHIPAGSILMVITHRPDWHAPFADDALATTVSLNRLGRKQVSHLVRAVANEAIDDAFLDQIVARSDGIPLFAEELTRSIADASRPGPASQVPESLQASFLARFDHLGEARQIAQIAAVLGKQFSHDMLVAAVDRSEAEATEGIERLVASGIVRRVGVPPDAVYAFRHSLAQDAAYESLLRAERRAIHGRIAHCIEQRFEELVRSEPEVIALHFEAADETDRAIAYWHAAAKLAAAKSANREAAAHCQRALALVERSPPGAERDHLELDLLILAGPQQMLSTGLVTREAEKIYLRAEALSSKTGTIRLGFQARWGLWHVNEFRAEWEAALEMADDLGEIARQSGEDSLLLQAHHAKWSTRVFIGDIVGSLEHATRGLEIYDWERHRRHAELFGGHDPGVCGRQMQTLIRSIMGQPAQSREAARQGLDLADRLEQPSSLSMMHFFTGLALGIEGDIESAAENAEQAVEAAERHGILPYAQMGRILRGWTRVRLGEIAPGLAELEALLEPARQKPRKRALLPAYLGLLADAYQIAGRIEEAIAAASEGLARAAAQGEFLWESELLRLLGALKLAQSRGSSGEASEHLRRAISKARASGSHLFGLKAAFELAEHLADSKNLPQALKVLDDSLAPIEKEAAARIILKARELRQQMA